MGNIYYGFSLKAEMHLPNIAYANFDLYWSNLSPRYDTFTMQTFILYISSFIFLNFTLFVKDETGSLKVSDKQYK